MEARKMLIDSGFTVNGLAIKFGVGRSSIYQSLDGDGSRRIRVVIAQIIGNKPSELWCDNPEYKKMLDDALFYTFTTGER